MSLISKNGIKWEDWDDTMAKCAVLRSIRAGDKLNVYNDGSIARGEAGWFTASMRFARRDNADSSVTAVENVADKIKRYLAELPKRSNAQMNLINDAASGVDRLAATYDALGRRSVFTALSTHARHMRAYVTNVLMMSNIRRSYSVKRH